MNALHFAPQLPDDLDDDATVIAVGRRAALLGEQVSGLLPTSVAAAWSFMVESLKPGDRGASTLTWLPGPPARRVIAAMVSERASRHNSPHRADAIDRLLRKAAPPKGDLELIIALDDPAGAFAAALAVARAFPLYSLKSGEKPERPRRVAVRILGPDGPIEMGDKLEPAAEGVRLAGRLVDAPTAELNTDAFVAEARAVAENLGCDFEVITGTELAERGFGGLAGVGRAARHPPALVRLTHAPEGAERTVAWVGKGIVYDTGGLSLKPKTAMVGMKADMGGAAAVLGAYRAAVELGFPDRLHAVLCLAENAVGPDAVRPDDVLTMYSGKTVEVNNTDAEGRLVLADGVAHAHKDLGADVIVDLATLTGAQLISTGKRIAAIVSNDDELESGAVSAGRASGDLVHPLPYVPEFFRSEFKSLVADMKNSVKDRMNAQSSCAAQFIAEHLGDFEGKWLHVDLAGPSVDGHRGTGFGVGLLLTLFGPNGW